MGSKHTLPAKACFSPHYMSLLRSHQGTIKIILSRGEHQLPGYLTEPLRWDCLTKKDSIQHPGELGSTSATCTEEAVKSIAQADVWDMQGLSPARIPRKP